MVMTRSLAGVETKAPKRKLDEEEIVAKVSSTRPKKVIKAMRNSKKKEALYCTCNRKAFGNMVACDNEDCKVKWFHFKCVEVRGKISGDWFCPDCRESRGFQMGNNDNPDVATSKSSENDLPKKRSRKMSTKAKVEEGAPKK